MKTTHETLLRDIVGRLDQIVERLDRIESAKRSKAKKGSVMKDLLDPIEKALGGTKKKK